MSSPFTLYNVAHSVMKNMDGNRWTQFDVDYMQMETLQQPMANNKCGFYMMWAMHVYRGSKREGNKMVCSFLISCILVNSTKHTTVFVLCISISSCFNNSVRNLNIKSY